MVLPIRALSIRARTPWICARCRVVKTPQLARSVASQAPLTSSTPPTEGHPTVPKPTIKIKAISDNIEYHTKNCEARNYGNLASLPARIGVLYDERYRVNSSIRADREKLNTLSGRLRSASPLASTDADGNENAETKESLIEEARRLKSLIADSDAKERALEEEMTFLAAQLPNTTHPAVPLTEPRIISYLNPHLAPPKGAERDVKSHTQIGAEMGLLDFSSAAKSSGWGWYYLLNDAVLLEQALVNYALTEARNRGWKLVSPPSMVYSAMALACGFRPRDQNDEQQIFAIEQTESQKLKPARSMAGTAEISLAAMKSNTILNQEEELPLKVVGASRCYRAEAGARGAETKGLYRVKEFTKVELFAWAPPPDVPDGPNAVADQIFDELLQLQCHILSSLKLHCRVMEMPASDLGASAHRKVDIEAFIPSRVSGKTQGWGEVSSLSNCTDYQSRRLGTRSRRASQKIGWAWTLNGTAMAVPRVLMAIMENNYMEMGGKGMIRVPQVLRPYMGGKEWIEQQSKI